MNLTPTETLDLMRIWLPARMCPKNELGLQVRRQALASGRVKKETVPPAVRDTSGPMKDVRWGWIESDVIDWCIAQQPRALRPTLRGIWFAQQPTRAT